VKIWKVILATLVIFIAGILTGAVMSRRHFHLRPPLPPLRETGEKISSPPGTNRETTRLTMPFNRPPGRGLAKDFLERLDKELALASDQRKRIQKILEESQKRNKEIWEKIAPEIREEMKRSRDEIREVLSSDQRKAMDELMKRPAKVNKEISPTNCVVPLPPDKLPPPSAVPVVPPAR
jgi:hypothetical protein